MSCAGPVIFSPAYKSLRASNIGITKTVCCSISCKPVSALINSEPVKSFVTCKLVSFSNVGIANDFNSVSCCSVTYIEDPVNAISSTVKKFFVSYRTACPVALIVVQTVNTIPLFCALTAVFLSKYVIT